ncbi:MAG: transporter substrate-binding domain-containing protein [Oscillospiraceae bacterium]|jgi:putative glutamine transport system substrate-binding protein|nr:transporter substrate-binding domain-containing protein [Oscillospiraceae bacterium]
MKKLWMISLALVLALTLGLSVTAVAEDAPDIAAIKARGKLLVGVKADVPSFGYQELGGEFEGLEIDLAKLLAAEILGDESAVEFTAVTAKTRGPLLDTGELDMVIATFTVKPDRLLQYDFSKPYYVDAIGLLVKKADGITGFADLNGKTIGVAQSATTKDALTAAAEGAGYNLEFAEFPTYPDIKAALDSGRVACFSVDKAILMGYLDETVELLPDSFASQPYGVALKKGNAGLLKLVDDKIAAIRTDGTADGLVSKWNLPAVDWAEVDAYGASIWAEAEELAKAQ